MLVGRYGLQSQLSVGFYIRQGHFLKDEELDKNLQSRSCTFQMRELRPQEPKSLPHVMLLQVSGPTEAGIHFS